MSESGFLLSLGSWNWFILGAVLLALELMSPGIFFLWFGLAAFATGALAFALPLNWQLQLVLFGIFAFIALLVWYRIQKNAASTPADALNLHQRGHAYIGRTLTLDQPILDGQGTLRIDDTRWRISGPDLMAGTKIRILRTEGTTLIVEPAEL